MGAALLLAAALTGCGEGKIQRGDLPEAAPPGFERVGINPSYRVVHMDSIAEIAAYCRKEEANPSSRKPRRIIACTVNRRCLVVLPAAGVFDAEKTRVTVVHEWAHTWGLVHDQDGRGWYNPVTGQRVSEAPALRLAMPCVSTLK